MREALPCSICLWNKYLPHLNRFEVSRDMSPFDETDTSLAAADQVERDPSSAAFFAPILEVRGNAEWRIARYEINNGRLFLGQYLLQNSKRAFVADENIKFAEPSMFLNMF